MPAVQKLEEDEAVHRAVNQIRDALDSATTGGASNATAPSSSSAPQAAAPPPPAAAETSQLNIGTRVEIQDVACNPELNGLHGTVTGTVTSAKGTTLFVVSLPASEGVKKKNVKGLKEKNLKLLPPAPPEPGV